MAMILTGEQIKQEVRNNRIVISPFNEKNVGPNSYDVTLADELWRYRDEVLDPRKEQEKCRIERNGDCWLLRPGILYLGRTVEYTRTPFHAPMLEGRSSLGRLGVSIHVTAGVGDVGFIGYWTMEITVVQPCWLYPGIRIGQLLYHEVTGERTQYSGKYQENEGVQASRIAWDLLYGK